MSNDWRFYALASALFAALTAVFGKLGVTEIHSDMATLIRTFIILLILAALVQVKGVWQNPQNLSHRSLLFLVLSSLATGASWVCYYRALQLGPASKVAPIDKTSVVFVVFFSLIFLGEKLSWKEGAGAALIALGAILMAL